MRRDVLGLEAVGLDDAVHTNRLYALGGAALRERFGGKVRYENSSSTPVQGRYRYLGTTFAPDAGELRYWIGLVNESLPLSEHYHLMLASKTAPLQESAGQPRATGNWRWEHWSGMGRVVRPAGAGGVRVAAGADGVGCTGHGPLLLPSPVPPIQQR